MMMKKSDHQKFLWSLKIKLKNKNNNDVDVDDFSLLWFFDDFDDYDDGFVHLKVSLTILLQKNKIHSKYDLFSFDEKITIISSI